MEFAFGGDIAGGAGGWVVASGGVAGLFADVDDEGAYFFFGYGGAEGRHAVFETAVADAGGDGSVVAAVLPDAPEEGGCGAALEFVAVAAGAEFGVDFAGVAGRLLGGEKRRGGDQQGGKKA